MNPVQLAAHLAQTVENARANAYNANAVAQHLKVRLESLGSDLDRAVGYTGALEARIGALERVVVELQDRLAGAR